MRAKACPKSPFSFNCAYRSLRRMTRERITLVLFLALVVGGGALLGAFFAPGEWYTRLAKPSFTPPNWVFAPAWLLLYILIAVAGYRTWLRDRESLPMTLWWTQMLLNFLWSPVFFGAHSIGLGMIVCLFLLANIGLFIFASWKKDKIAAFLFMPYAAWVSFALALNVGIFILNEGL